MVPTGDGGSESVADLARRGSGLATVYRALDRLVSAYDLRDAALVVDVPELGRQVLRAGRRPLSRDERRLHAAPPGFYAEPEFADALAAELALALGTLGLRHDLAVARGDTRSRETAEGHR